MKRKLYKTACFISLKHFGFFILFVMIGTPAFSQIEDSGQILRAGTEDAQVLLKEYLKPFGGGFGADMNTGWFTSARPLRKFGIDLRASVSASLVPVHDRTFDISKLDLESVKLLNGPAKTPTVFGDDKVSSILGSTEFNSSTQQEEVVFSFKMPRGSGYHIVPAPMAQFTLGLPGHSQATLRYSPEFVFQKDYKIRLFGIGGLVGLNQLFFNDQLPFDISLQAGTMNLNTAAKFRILPSDDSHIENRFSNSHWSGQAIKLDINTFTSNLIIGKKSSVLSLFGGFGYQYASTSITAEGPYPIVVPLDEDERNSPNSTHEIQSVAVPIDIKLDGANTIHVLGGFQLRLGFLSLSASYTVSEYSTVRAGIGIMFRSG